MLAGNFNIPQEVNRLLDDTLCKGCVLVRSNKKGRLRCQSLPFNAAIPCVITEFFTLNSIEYLSSDSVLAPAIFLRHKRLLILILG